MEELTGFEPALMVLQTISLTNLDTTPPEKMAGTSGFEPEHAGVKVLCLTGLATSQYIIYGGQNMVGRAGFEPASRFRPTVFKTASSPSGHTAYFGASHGTRTRTRKSELPPQDSVSTKFHQERILYLDIAGKP